MIAFFLSGAIYFLFFKPAPTVLNDSASQTKVVVEALRDMQKKIDDAKVHIEALASDIHARQTEVEEAEKVRTDLGADIEEKLKEVDAWKTLSKQQKSLFVQAANEAMRKTNTLQVLGVVVGSVLLNLAASVIWSLMGSPGQKELREMFQSFQSLFR